MPVEATGPETGRPRMRRGLASGARTCRVVSQFKQGHYHMLADRRTPEPPTCGHLVGIRLAEDLLVSPACSCATCFAVRFV